LEPEYPDWEFYSLPGSSRPPSWERIGTANQEIGLQLLS